MRIKSLTGAFYTCLVSVKATASVCDQSFTETFLSMYNNLRGEQQYIYSVKASFFLN